MKLQIPAAFATEATEMPVRGLNGLKFKPRLKFGDFETLPVKRGVVFSRSITTTEGGYFFQKNQILRKVGIYENHVKNKKNSRFSYTLKDTRISGHIICQESLVTETDFYKNPWRIQLPNIQNQEYNFSGVILPLAGMDSTAWVIRHTALFDRYKDSSQHTLGIPLLQEKGFVTNGKDSIFFRPVRISKTYGKNKEELDLPIRLLGGFEFSVGEGVICITDVLSRKIWIYNELDAETKFIVAATASALLLRKQMIP